MIYNLVQLLKTNFPTETFYANQEMTTQGIVADKRCIVMESGGTDRPDTRLIRQRVQFNIRDLDGPKARVFAYQIYNYLQSRWGLILPSVTVDGVLFPQIESAELTAIQIPQSMGKDDNGRSVFVFNFIVIWEA